MHNGHHHPSASQNSTGNDTLKYTATVLRITQGMRTGIQWLGRCVTCDCSNMWAQSMSCSVIVQQAIPLIAVRSRKCDTTQSYISNFRTNHEWYCMLNGNSRGLFRNADMVFFGCDAERSG
jgi:hypothetical protein